MQFSNYIHFRYLARSSNKLCIICLWALTIAIMGCQDNLFQYGKKETKKEKCAPFNYLIFEDLFDVQLIQADTFGIITTTGSELIENIKITPHGDSLIISNENTARWSRKYEKPEIQVIFPTIKKITLQEPCNVSTVDTIHIPHLIFWAISEVSEVQLTINAQQLHFANASTSAGKYILAGNVTKLNTWIRCSGILDAKNLHAQEVSLRSTTIGDCKVTVTKKLHVSIENKGYIYYYGKPETITTEDSQDWQKIIPME